MEIFLVSQLSTVGRHVTHTRLSGSTSAPCVTMLNPCVSSLACSLDRIANPRILVFAEMLSTNKLQILVLSSEKTIEGDSKVV